MYVCRHAWANVQAIRLGKDGAERRLPILGLVGYEAPSLDDSKKGEMLDARHCICMRLYEVFTEKFALLVLCSRLQMALLAGSREADTASPRAAGAGLFSSHGPVVG